MTVRNIGVSQSQSHGESSFSFSAVCLCGPVRHLDPNQSLFSRSFSVALLGRISAIDRALIDIFKESFGVPQNQIPEVQECSAPRSTLGKQSMNIPWM